MEITIQGIIGLIFIIGGLALLWWWIIKSGLKKDAKNY